MCKGKTFDAVNMMRSLREEQEKDFLGLSFEEIQKKLSENTQKWNQKKKVAFEGVGQSHPSILLTDKVQF